MCLTEEDNLRQHAHACAAAPLAPPRRRPAWPHRWHARATAWRMRAPGQATLPAWRATAFSCLYATSHYTPASSPHTALSWCCFPFSLYLHLLRERRQAQKNERTGNENMQNATRTRHYLYAHLCRPRTLPLPRAFGAYATRALTWRSPLALATIDSPVDEPTVPHLTLRLTFGVGLPANLWRAA